MRVVESGIGAESARASAESALGCVALADALVVGLCGATAPFIAAGDVLVYGSIERPSGERIGLDPGLVRDVQTRLSGAHAGMRGLSVDAVVSSADRKRELFARGIDAVDMESFAVAERLRAATVRTAIVRAASDGPDDDLPDFSAAIDANGKLRGGAVAAAMLRRPHAAWRMSAAALRALRAIERSVAALLR